MIKLLGLLVMSFALLADAAPETKTVVIIMGPPGSGKGTQATGIANTLGIPHISTGAMLRDEIQNETDLGRKVQGHVEAGRFAPDDLILDVLFDRVSKPDATRGYLLDGFPRNLVQAAALDKRLEPGTRLIVLNLQVSDPVLIQRIASRGQGRADDSEAVVKERLKEYQKQTAPLIDYYKKKGVLIQINGEQTPEAVSKDIRRALPKGA